MSEGEWGNMRFPNMLQALPVLMDSCVAEKQRRDDPRLETALVTMGLIWFSGLQCTLHVKSNQATAEPREGRCL